VNGTDVPRDRTAFEPLYRFLQSLMMAGRLCYCYPGKHGHEFKCQTPNISSRQRPILIAYMIQTRMQKKRAEKFYTEGSAKKYPVFGDVPMRHARYIVLHPIRRWFTRAASVRSNPRSEWLQARRFPTCWTRQVENILRHSRLKR